MRCVTSKPDTPEEKSPSRSHSPAGRSRVSWRPRGGATGGATQSHVHDVYRGYGSRRPWLVVQAETIMTTATRPGDLRQPGPAQPTAKTRIGSMVALSMAAGLTAAVVLVA